LTILQVRGEWLEVTFVDPQFGRRTGWVQRDYVRINTAPPPEQEPAPGKPAPGGPPLRTAPTPAAQRARTTSSNQVGVRGFGTIAFDKMTASDSFKAVTESDTTTLFGGGVQGTNLWRGLFAEVGAEVTSLDGERVFVGPDDEVFRLGIPVQIKMRRVDVVVGWRTTVDRFTTYGAAGPTFLKYEETSDFADPGENVDQSNTGFVLLGGGEISVTRWVHIRGEVRYRRIKDAIGLGGVSAHFDETDLGGFGAALKIAVGR
jgi:opacity protein-like surface antigen